MRGQRHTAATDARLQVPGRFSRTLPAEGAALVTSLHELVHVEYSKASKHFHNLSRVLSRWNQIFRIRALLGHPVQNKTTS